MNKGLERLAGRALDRARLHAIGKGLHGGAARLDCARDRLALGPKIGTVGGAQGGMQDGAILRGIDHRPAKQARPRRLEVRRAR